MNLFITKKRGFSLLACLLAIWLFSPSQAMAQINSFPYSYDFEAEGQGSTGCNPIHVMQQSNWLNVTGDDMDWTADKQGTSSGSTGPSDDHTPGAGDTYMYLETSCTSASTRFAYLETPVFDFTSATSPQLSFWYHMYGATIGTLNFEVSTNGGTSWTTLFTRTGAQQNSSAASWQQAVVNIAAYGGQSNVKFRFSGSTGSSYTGDMAIDDVLIENIVPNNAGVTAMVSPLLGSLAGNYSVDIIVQNFGSNAINAVDVEWQINGVSQTAVSYTGAAIPSATNTVMNLSASTAFSNGITSMKFWTSNPNGVVDADFGNDTLETIFCTGLSGTYTVGTPSSDFPTIADALVALNGCGMVGPVTMNVQGGTYTTPIVLANTISGLSATNTLIWDGANQTAVIQVAAGVAITLDGTDHVTIRNFRINHTSATAGMGILLMNQADSNTIVGNRIVLASTDFSSACIAASNSATSPTSSGDNANHTLIANNTLVGSYRAISMYGQFSAANYNTNNTIRNNDISNCSNYGIYVYYQDYVTIDNNYIHDFSSTFHYGLYAYYTMNSVFQNNKIILDDYGIYFGRMNSEATPAITALVANNMVISKTDRACYGYFIRSSNFYHNTFKANRSAIELSNLGTAINIKNNIFYSETNYAFFTTATTVIAGMDYNAFYTPTANTNFIRYSSTYSDLLDWQTNNPNAYGTNSQEGMPSFIGPLDLHLDGAFLNDMGTNVGIMTDIDGDTRPATGATAVDIGADEFTPPDNDAGVKAMLSPVAPISAGFATVIINVGNFGINPLSSFSIEWEINGVAQTPVAYTGATIPVLGNTTINLANINFPTTTTQLKFWTTMPNGLVDDRLTNDTLEIMVCPGLQGTYTVGHATSDFPTVADVTNALMSCGVSGATEFQFQTGTYNGALVLNAIPGASAINTVTFNGLNPANATLTHDATGTNGAATVALDGASHVTIKNFTITSTGITPAYGVLLTNAANYNHILNNIITVPYSSGTNNVVGVLASASYMSSTGSAAAGNNTNWTNIEGNNISGGSAAVILNGGTFNQENIGNSILNNDIHNADNYGIFVEEQDTFKIINNKVYALQSNFSDAVYCNDIHHFEIMSNTITSNDYGIYVAGGFGTTDRAKFGKIVNNMVNSIGNTAEGLYLTNVDTIQIYHNTLQGSPAVYVNRHNQIDLRNNIMVTSNDYCFETPSSLAMAAMDYNLYYVTGTGDVVNFGGTTYNTLTNWQTTGVGGYDANAVTGNPNFVNGLHVGSAISEDAATSALLFNVTTDIDGQNRPMGAASDIGADEHVTITYDAMSVALVSPSGCGSTSSSVVVSIANVGTDTLNSIPVIVNVTGAATQSFNATHATLLPATTANIAMGTLNTATGGTYNFQIIVAAGADTNHANDTLNVSLNMNPSNQNALTNVGDTLVCLGNSATLVLNSTVSGASILWYDSITGGNLLTNGNTYTTPALTGNTTYYAQLQGCNSTRKSVTIQTDMVGITVDLGADTTTICSGTTLDIIPVITGSPSVAIVWSNGAMTSHMQVATTGMYTVMVTNINGCTSTDTIQVQHSTVPTILDTISNPTCGGQNDGSIHMGVSGTASSYTYNWSNGQATQNLNNLSAGVYALTITDNSTALACTYNRVMNLTTASPIVSLIDRTTLSCNGTDGTVSMTVTGGSGAYTYMWSNGDTTQDLTGLAGGTYTVTVADASGCTANNTATITAPTPLVITVDTIHAEVLNIGGAINLTVTGGSGSYSYAWSNGQTTQNATNLTAGSYSVTVVDSVTHCEINTTGMVVAYQIPDAVTTLEDVNTFDLYPNPTTGKVYVQLSLNKATEVQLEITNIAGQTLQSFKARQAMEQNYEIDMSAYPTGVYLARFIVGNQVTTTKIILSKD